VPNRPTVFLGGKKKSGKDFIADQLVARAGYTKYHLVRPWLEGFCARHGLAWDRYEAEKAQWRPLVQEEATEARRLDPDCLVRAFEAAFPALPRPLAVVGLRFVGEGRMAIGLGGLMLRVECPDDVRRERFVASGESPNLFDDPFESEVDSMPVHAEVPGTLAADEIIPLVESIWKGIIR
jgi:hypothetical protein